jgi:hypothetical protein
MKNLDPRWQQVLLNARHFIGYTKLEHLVHADATGLHSLDMLKRLLAVEQELAKLPCAPQSAMSPQQLKALQAAVRTTQEVIRLTWKHHHGKSLDSNSAANKPAPTRLTKVMA